MDGKNIELKYSPTRYQYQIVTEKFHDDQTLLPQPILDMYV
jgi:hypothetical protein